MSDSITLTIAEGVKLVKSVPIPMRDSVRLAADLYMPAATDGADRWPVVMEYIPYRKDDVHLASRPFYLAFPRHGYVVARVDVRGTGASEGISTDECTPFRSNSTGTTLWNGWPSSLSAMATST